MGINKPYPNHSTATLVMTHNGTDMRIGVGQVTIPLAVFKSGFKMGLLVPWFSGSPVIPAAPRVRDVVILPAPAPAAPVLVGFGRHVDDQRVLGLLLEVLALLQHLHGALGHLLDAALSLLFLDAKMTNLTFFCKKNSLPISISVLLNLF